MQVFSSEYLKIKMQNTLYMVLYSIHYILHKCKYILNCVICIFSCLIAIKVKFALNWTILSKRDSLKEQSIEQSTSGVRWTIHSNVTPKVPSIGSKLTDQYLLLFRHQFVAKLGIRGWAGVRDQTEPTNFWQKSLEEANSGKLQIQNWNNDDKKKVEVSEGALSVCWREPDLWCWC